MAGCYVYEVTGLLVLSIHLEPRLMANEFPCSSLLHRRANRSPCLFFLTAIPLGLKRTILCNSLMGSITFGSWYSITDELKAKVLLVINSSLYPFSSISQQESLTSVGFSGIDFAFFLCS